MTDPSARKRPDLDTEAIGTGRRLVAVGALAAKAAPGTLALYCVVNVISGGLPVVAAWLTKTVLDRVVATGTEPLLWPLVGLTAVGVVTGVSPQVIHYLRAELERETELLGQSRLYTAVGRFTGLGRFEDPWFLDRLRMAQHASRTSAVEGLDGALGIIRSVVTLAGFTGALLVLNPLITLVILLSGVVSVLAEIALSRRRARMLWTIKPAERREFFYADLLASVEAAKEVRLFGVGDFLRDRMLTERRRTNGAKRAVDRREVYTQAGLGLLTALVSGAGLAWAVSQARAGRLSVGDVTMLVAATVGVQAALSALAAEVARAHQALSTFAYFLAVILAEPDLPVPAAPRELPELRGEIEFRNVWFRYSDGHPWVLRGVNLRIPCGKSMALIGLNGAGKSTFVKLLCRFYDPTKGSILWDGVDIREVDPAELRRRIGAVFQDFMHYDMVAAECVGLGNLDVMSDRSRIEAAAEKAGIHHTLSRLPQGYDTMLSRLFFMDVEEENPDAGVVLSGGQQQRLALARAFLRDRRDLMILDEPSAGLDAEAEHEIHASLRHHREGRTSLLISHRLGAVRDADVIVVLSGGKVAEQGDHASLVSSGGAYARLFGLQASGYRIEGSEEPASTGGS
ncbi:ABC transporter ATP-binding protein [Streptomyces mobaraensis]|uniref:ABC transporter ATP-binding protein n=1 Tax=Streptomyces mobaraensis TaxID=35621 RepID=UPI00331D503B